MSDQNSYLETFPGWLRTLGDDALALAEMLSADGLSTEAAEAIVSGINYLFKSLDLIPDGIDDIGYLDDAFVLRVCAGHAMNADHSALGEEQAAALGALAKDAELVSAFLEDDYSRLDAYCNGLKNGSARGRKVKDIVADEELRSALVSDARGFAESFEPPAFAREEKNLKKLRAFFDAKLP